MSKRVNSKFTIDVDGKTLRFKLPLFDDNGKNTFENVEKTILYTDLSNIIGEMLVAPIIMNRLGVLQGESYDQVREAKINYEIWEAKTIKKFRTKRSDDGERNPTKLETEEHILLHLLRASKIKKYNRALKTQSNINSLYWSFKEKQENLKKLSLTLQQGELDSHTVERALESLNYITKIKRQNN